MNGLEHKEIVPILPEAQSESFEILDSPELRTEYITLTDDMISKMAAQKTDVAIFLDKSARPVAWMMQSMWDQLRPQLPDGSAMPMPAIKFLNIDREQWGAILGRSEDQGIDAQLLPQERVDELHSLFHDPRDKNDSTSTLRDKRIMIVDEVRVSGDTLEMAGRILVRAFPDAKDIRGCYWMDGQVKTDPKTGVRKNTRLPVWYSDRIVTGRLVGNRDSTKSSFSASRAQRLGRYWLSATFREQDQRGLKLKEEMKLMANELREHELPYMPVALWDDEIDPVESRIERINQMSLEDYVKLRRQNLTTASFVQAYREFKRLLEN